MGEHPGLDFIPPLPVFLNFILDATASVIHNLYGQVSLALNVRVSAARVGKCRSHHRFARVKTIFQDNKGELVW